LPEFCQKLKLAEFHFKLAEGARTSARKKKKCPLFREFFEKCPDALLPPPNIF
jgi:hypothetical protein